MTKKFIEYRSGYKHQLASDYSMKIEIKPKQNINDNGFIKLDKNGNLTVSKGYAWDGMSGPVRDTEENMRATLVHDALYQLMRHNYLDAKDHKEKADKLFKKICIEDGVSEFFAGVYYFVLEHEGKPYTEPRNKKKVRRAPK